MKVLVTGGAGKVGIFVVRELLRRGHQVTVAGRTPNLHIEGASYMVLDCTDYAAVRRAVAEHETVVHLAAIPMPKEGLSCPTFQINCLGTYHIYEACVEAGIKKLAVASSINALGMFFGVKELPVRYFPIDELHPQLCSDMYSFSKKVIEDIGQFYWNSQGISSVAIRIPWVRPAEPGNERLVALKGQRDPQEFFLYRNYWVWIDARDSARAFADGIEAPYEGAHAIFCNDNVNSMGIPTRELVAAHYGYVTDWREPIAGYETLVSCKKAKEILGWEPIYNTVIVED